MYRYLFGPVASRRLGRSLGIDLTPDRQCCFDCVFCEVGRTHDLRIDRGNFAPVHAVLNELRTWLEAGGTADVITLAGSGEPTLHTGLGALVDGIQACCPIPVVVLTNGALLSEPAVRAALSRVDLVKVSLSVWDEASLIALNRPAAGISFARLVDGLRAFSHDYQGRLWIETILVRGINDAPDQVARIASLVAPLNAERVQLNTVVRPPSFPGMAAVPPDELGRLASLFSPPAEVVGVAPVASHKNATDIPVAELVATLSRRPCTIEDLATGLGLASDVVREWIRTVPAEVGIVSEEQDGKRYYRVAEKPLDWQS